MRETREKRTREGSLSDTGEKLKIKFKRVKSPYWVFLGRKKFKTNER